MKAFRERNTIFTEFHERRSESRKRGLMTGRSIVSDSWRKTWTACLIGALFII